ncbi:TetR/AcrR family transcriptional regulator [Lactococcus lactis]|uniref:TetR/AcrR family transcriptional regulator n=1 Tax=Lactococcus lactis TaxID=1358 RepID=UPI00206D5483|nr:TetR/AcrR family transcriptional regulator [Lactococcus lactis]BDH85017.1 TetR family transcriptional regulator [Lactococcus lactis]
MEKLTKTKILDTASILVAKKGMGNVTLTYLASELNITHAALYKHFKNKQDLWTSLALNWLDNVLEELYAYKPETFTEKIDALHHWLWLLVSHKRFEYENNRELFSLYTEYIENNPEVREKHLLDLTSSLEDLLKIKNKNFINTILNSFVVFYVPNFSFTWNDEFKQNFEYHWEILKPSFLKVLQVKRVINS